ncbi:RagB/SusD family nutrient uptake outer membrane protein [Pedobacter chitinilyticus]|uniref:RagB/SusD family nutrient uptake outer membrane protein n=1 Tax=Pedobacter chitinilyticus TaxID=2233776 RepID=A0A443YVX6_9SPHI|nr:RagB/SusD family nutrient uptake outer membrane protein [Pedobacter chitinilyticus]RWU08144.1 RagB/SusD family nutrient uptake outer membrane protein [Pedobacter chitinilyticus]
MKKKLYTIMLLSVLLMRCEKFVDVGEPKNQLVTASVFENDGHAIAAITNIYSQMINKGNSYLLPYYTGIAGDELTNYSTNGLYVQLYQNSVQPLDAPTNSFWDSAYSSIYLANAAYEGCDRSRGMSSSVKKQLMAEARFVRAFWYFYLINLFGDVPLITGTDYQANAIAARSSKNNVYDQIVSDLDYAVQNLNTGYVDASSVSTYSERIRPNQFAARALLARTYLYMGNWAKAEELSSTVIANTATYDLASLSGAFLKNNKEAIWQLSKPDNVGNLSTQEGQGFILINKPIVTGVLNCSAISPQLLGAFASNDLRLSTWIASYIDKTVTPNVTYYFSNKYRERNNTTSVEYTTPLRLAEQYLIRAEARNEQNNTGGARDDLNKVRSRTGTGNTSATTQADLRVAILKERQLELFTEWGQRWMDLKRTGNINTVMATVATTKGAIWNSNKQLFPIPQKDIEANRNLKQNTGYN